MNPGSIYSISIVRREDTGELYHKGCWIEFKTLNAEINNFLGRTKVESEPFAQDHTPEKRDIGNCTWCRKTLR